MNSISLIFLGSIVMTSTTMAFSMPRHQPDLVPRNPPAFNKSLPWVAASCSVTDHSNAVDKIWDDTHADDVFNWVKDRWNTNPRPDGGNFPYTAYFSYNFQGPYNWDCSTFGSLSNCAQTLGHCGDRGGTAGDVDVPGAYVIMDSFVQIHNVHQTIHDDLGNVQSSMQAQVGNFQSTFCPQLKSQTDLWKAILDTLGFMTGFFYAATWNNVMKGVFKDLKSDYHGETKDAYNTLIGQSITVASRHLPASTTALGIQNDIASTLGKIANYWQEFIAEQNTALFSGDADDMNALYGIINHGAALNTLQFDDQAVLSLLQTILFGYMIPNAWAVSPAGLHPFVVATTDDCTNFANPDAEVLGMNDDIASNTHVCWNGVTYYVLNAKSGGGVEALPGGDLTTLSNGNWGGITLEDIVVSTVTGYQANNNANGYKMPDVASLLKEGDTSDGDSLALTGSVRTPGFFGLPFCDSTKTFTDNQNAGKPSMLNWPCF